MSKSTFVAVVATIFLLAVSSFPVSAQPGKTNDDHSAPISLISALFNWNGGVPVETEASLYSIASHPSVVANVKMSLSDKTMAKNAAVGIVYHNIEMARAGKREEVYDELGRCSHILLSGQESVFDRDDFDALLELSNLNFVYALSPLRRAPSLPAVIPSYESFSSTSLGKKWIEAMKAKKTEEYDLSSIEFWEEVVNELISRGEPFSVAGASLELGLLNLKAMEKVARRFGNEREWWWNGAMTLTDTFYYETGPSCRDLVRSLRSRDVFERQYLKTVGDVHPWIGLIDEDELCFAGNVKKFGYQVYVAPNVAIGLRVSQVLRYPTSTSSIQEVQVDGDLAHTTTKKKKRMEELEISRGYVVENRLKAARQKNTEYAYITNEKMFQVVLITVVYEDVHPETFASLYTLAQHPDIIGRVVVSHHSIAEGRNVALRLVEEEFGEEYTHVLFIDGDMSFEILDYARLARSGLPIVLGLTVRRRVNPVGESVANNPPALLPFKIPDNEFAFASVLYALSNLPVPGMTSPSPLLLPVRAGGMAFCLIRKEVIVDLRQVNEVTQVAEWFWSEHSVDEDSHNNAHLSEDFSFCVRARDLGYEVYVNVAAQVRHIDTSLLHIGHWLNTTGIDYVVKE